MQELKLGVYSGNVLLKKRAENILSSVTSYNADNFNNSIHYHNNAHFSFTLDGGCVERKRDSYEIVPGNITYYSAGEIHQVIKIPKATRRVNLEMEESFFHQFQITDEIVRRSVTNNPEARILMAKITRELFTTDGLSDTTLKMLLLQLVADARKYMDGNTPGWIETVREFLHTNTDDHITLANLSAIANLHPVSISKLFPKYFSCTVGEYKRKLKVARALEVIKTGNISLTETAYECGFFDQSHFIRTFKNLAGILPTEYRKL